MGGLLHSPWCIWIAEWRTNLSRTNKGKKKWVVSCSYSFFSFSVSHVPLVELWKHRFASQCLSLVHDQAFGARTPSYKVIQELDRKVRDFYTPPSLQVPGFGGPMAEIEPSSPSLTMQRYIGLSIKEICEFSDSLLK